jgi:hypothetical protein
MDRAREWERRVLMRGKTRITTGVDKRRREWGRRKKRKGLNKATKGMCGGNVQEAAWKSQPREEPWSRKAEGISKGWGVVSGRGDGKVQNEKKAEVSGEGNIIERERETIERESH